MKGRVLVLLVLGMCALFSLARADISTRNLLYEVWIEKEIGRCSLRANLVYSRGENLRNYGKKAAAQETFYRHNKYQLVREMVEETVGTKPYKVNYFLISAYKHQQSGSLLAVR
jgi:hypothetical protein